MEDSAPAIAQGAAAEHLEQRLFHVAEEVAGLDTDHELDLERDGERRVDFQIDSCHSKSLQAVAQFCFKLRIDSLPAKSVDCKKHRVPASGPTESRRCA